MARLPAVLASKIHDVEHALVMYAHSFVLMPAAGIYDDAALARFAPVLVANTPALGELDLDATFFTKQPQPRFNKGFRNSFPSIEDSSRLL